MPVWVLAGLLHDVGTWITVTQRLRTCLFVRGRDQSCRFIGTGLAEGKLPFLEKLV